MRILSKQAFVLLPALALCLSAGAKIEGSLDPDCVVAGWSNASTYPKVIDINFSDEMWPGQTWQGETGADCPEMTAEDNGGYVNTVVNVPANGGTDVTYPVLFHHCTFANKTSYNGLAGVTSAFARQYYLGQGATGSGTDYPNDWTVAGHTTYLEDNIRYGADGVTPNYGEAGFVQLCRNQFFERDPETNAPVSAHGWMEIDHIPYVERVQWSWSSTSWGRGIKAEIKIGDGEWQELVSMPSNMHKQGYTSFSDQGYFMENVIDASDVSIRWTVHEGSGGPYAQCQTARLHKIQIFGQEITAEQAQYATENPVSDVGELSDLGDFGGGSSDPAPDDDALVEIKVVAQDGTGDYTSVQAAIDAVSEGARGIIYIRPGEYDENIYAGTRNAKNKYISLIGENRETTILTSDVSRGSGNEGNSYNDCAALNVYTDRFYAENLTIRNTSGNVGQAEALYTAGDAHVFNNCLLSGFQDTYKANVGARGYFTNCTVEGAIDFIYDGGLEWFEGCEIRCLPGGSYITAAAEAGLSLTDVLYPELSASPFHAGLFFSRCNVTAADGVADGSYYLGRPWGENCGTMFINCTLGSHVRPEGWADWDGRGSLASYYEYNNVDADGNAVDTGSRAPFSHQASAAEVEAYMNATFLFGKASDVPFDYERILRGAATPSDFDITDNGFSWTSDDMAAGYLIYKDGVFVDFVTAPSYETDGGDASAYSVKAVSRHGVTSSAAAVRGALPAFPTAEGFGKYTTGGRGGQVVTVTSLGDNGSEGTLRWAFQQYPDEPLTIVFAVNGEIRLNSTLSVNRSDWTLAGQTAGGDGISIVGDKVNFGNSQNFIVRNVRFRSGDGKQDQACGTENCANYIFDHCVFGWSMEENMNTADSHFLTVQYSIVHEGLNDAGHAKGARGYGSQWGGSPATYHHNLLAGNDSRSPRFNGARGEDYVVFMEYINNVNFNWGRRNSVYGGENTADITEYNGLNSVHECNFMNNYYKPGPESPSNSVFFVSSYAREGATSWAPSKWYVAGNVMEGNHEATADNWEAVEAEHYSLDDIRAGERIVTQTPYYRYNAVLGNTGEYDPERYMLTAVQTAEEAYETVLAEAGTINRDEVETRIINDVRTGEPKYTGSKTGKRGIIDSVDDAEGLGLEHAPAPAEADSDADGMPDEWETAHGLDPQDGTDRNLVNRDGYTALEVYLNGLMGEVLDDDFTSGITQAATAAPVMSYDAATHTLTVSDNAVGGTLCVYATDGRMLSSRTIRSVTMNIAGLPAGVVLLRVSGNGLSPRLLKVRI